MAQSPTPERTARQLAAYAAPALPLAALSLPFYVMVPEFYARDLGVPLATVGAVLFAVRIMDAISDPLAGHLADRTQSRFGRRKLWVALGTPFIALAAYALFAPPADAGAMHLALWATLLSLAWTAVQVPYLAWGAENSRSYEGRTRVTAFRETGTVVGTLLALLLPALIQQRGGSSADGLHGLALFVALSLPFSVLIALAAAPEPALRVARPGQQPGGWRASLALLVGNRAFVRLLAAFLVNSLANGLPATLFLFFVADRLGARDQAGPLLVLYFLCGVAGVPFWLWLARRWSKHRAWAAGMVLACVCFAAAPLLGQGDAGWFALVCIGTGLALGADVVLPAAMQADVIDIDAERSGQERAGLYLGLWALATKLALAGAVGLAFPLLAYAGFDPANSRTTPEGLAMLGFLYAGLPVLLKVVAVALVLNFPLSRDEVDRRAQRLGSNLD